MCGSDTALWALTQLLCQRLSKKLFSHILCRPEIFLHKTWQRCMYECKRSIKTNSDISPQITGIMSNWDHVCYLLHALKRQPLCPKHTECFQLCGLLCWIRVSQSYMQVSPKSNTESRLKSSLLKPTSPRWRYKSRHVKSNKSGQKNKTKKLYLTCDQK